MARAALASRGIADAQRSAEEGRRVRGARDAGRRRGGCAPQALSQILDLVLYGLAYIAPFARWGTLGFVYSESNGLIVLAYLLGGICMYFTAQSLMRR